MSHSPKYKRTLGDMVEVISTPDNETPKYSGSYDPETGEVNVNRDLNHVYLFGNTKGDLTLYNGNNGASYNKYLKESGIDPDNVPVYEGIIKHDNLDLTFPQYAQPYIQNLAESGLGKTVGYYSSKGDNVAGHLGKVDINRNGRASIVMSDLWDFGKGYAKNWGVPLQAKVLNVAGSPFILKDDSNEIKYASPESPDAKMTAEKLQIMLNAGIIPEIEVRPRSLGEEDAYITVGGEDNLQRLAIKTKRPELKIKTTPSNYKHGGSLNYFDYFK